MTDAVSSECRPGGNDSTCFGTNGRSLPQDSPSSVGPTGASSPRLLVLQVTANENVKTLRVLETRAACELTLRLHGQWFDSSVVTSHVVRVILFARRRYRKWRTAEHVCSQPIDIDNEHNLLIIHPDTLISGTTVSDSFRCLRKSILSARTPMGLDSGIVGEAALFGSMIHDLFQNVLVLDSHSRDYSNEHQISQYGGPDLMSFFEATDDVLNRHSDTLFAAGIPLPHALKVLHKIVPQVYQWYQQVMGSGNYLNTQGVLAPASGKTLANVIVTQVHDIEELVWSPALGLKGKIDASVHLRVNGEDKGIAVLELKSGKAGGFGAMTHAAQVSLYNLLLSDRNDRPVTDGFLTYIRYQRALQSVRDDETRLQGGGALEDSNGNMNGNGGKGGNLATNSANSGGRIKLGQSMGKFEDELSHRLIPTMRSELVSLIIQRNAVAQYMRSDADIEDLPPLLQQQKDTCQRCFAADSCMIQYRLLQNGSEHSLCDGPGSELFVERAGHLKRDHAAYYTFWRSVLADEEEQATRGARTAWTKRAAVKEVQGRCASELVFHVPNASDPTDASPHALLSPGAHTVAQFHRAKPRDDGRTLLQCGLKEGDYVIVSAERKHKDENESDAILEGCETWQTALTNGFVTEVSVNSIAVSVDRSLSAWAKHQGLEVGSIIWRVDGEETAVSHTIAKRTLETLFMSEASRPGMTRRRELIVDGVAPHFTATAGGPTSSGISIVTATETSGSANKKTQPTTKISTLTASLQRARQNTTCNNSNDASCKPEISEKDLLESLNDEQRRAVELSFRARDYLLILGMPGTGKTATLAAIVASHALRGKSVLLCSHTNMAVDNLFLRLLSLGFRDIMRLGRNLNVVDPAIHDFHVSRVVERVRTGGGDWREVERAVDGVRIVATTCLGIGHWVLQRRKAFDLVVVDEASQMIQPVCIGPLLLASGAFVLVGDHYQLPPLRRAGVGVGRRLTALDAQERNDPAGMTTPETSAGYMAEESLFRRLCVKQPSSLVLLLRQYRMADDIMALCNELVYGGSMQCGDAGIGARRLSSTWRTAATHGPEPESGLSLGLGGGSWLDLVRNPDVRVLFIDTARHVHGMKRDTMQTEKEGEVQNHAEASIMQQCVSILVQDSVDAGSITVLSAFRAQVELIRTQLSAAQDTKGCVLSTIDQYQGKDNDCVLVSLVRSDNQDNGRTTIGPLLRDWRRINVAMTRAKRKLVFVGCAHTMTQVGSHFLKHLVKYLEARKAIRPFLPAEGELHKR